MPSPDEIKRWLQDRLDGLLAEHRGPGAAVAVAVDGHVVDHAAGVLSKATGVEATVDSVFQIGSITKVWTSTLVMQLVDAGAVELDAPVRRYLPDLRLADEGAAAAITVRQLLTSWNASAIAFPRRSVWARSHTTWAASPTRAAVPTGRCGCCARDGGRRIGWPGWPTSMSSRWCWSCRIS